MIVSLIYARIYLSKLIRKTQSGQEIIITKYGKPVAKIKAYKKQ